LIDKQKNYFKALIFEKNITFWAFQATHFGFYNLQSADRARLNTLRIYFILIRSALRAIIRTEFLIQVKPWIADYTLRPFRPITFKAFFCAI